MKRCGWPPSDGVVVEDGDRAGRVAGDGDDLDRAVADGDGVTVRDGAGDRDAGLGRDRVGVLDAGDGDRRVGVDDGRQGAVVVPVLVRGDHRRDAGLADERQDRLGLGGRVDEHLLAGLLAAQEVGVVRHLLVHGDLGDRQVLELADVGRAADLHLAGVAAGVARHGHHAS